MLQIDSDLVDWAKLFWLLETNSSGMQRRKWELGSEAILCWVNEKSIQHAISWSRTWITSQNYSKNGSIVLGWEPMLLFLHLANKKWLCLNELGRIIEFALKVDHYQAIQDIFRGSPNASSLRKLWFKLRWNKCHWL